MEPNRIDLKTIEVLDKKIEEALKPLPQPQQPQRTIPSELTLPSLKEFQDFYEDYTLFMTPLVSELKDNILTIRNSTPNARPLQIGIYAVAELVADKFKIPVSRFYPSGTTLSPLPDFDSIHARLEKECNWIAVMFSNLFSQSDPRIAHLCKEYHRLNSAPLILRLRFYEFEKSLFSKKIEFAIQEAMKANNEKIRQFEKDYQQKLEREKLKFRTQLDEAKREAMKLRNAANILQEQLGDAHDKIYEIKSNTSNTSERLKDAEESAADSVRKLSDAELKIKSLEKGLKKYTEQPWRIAITSTPEKLTFHNPETGQIVKLPENFKADYTLDRKVGEDYVYIDNSGKEYKIPESLELKFSELTKPASPKVNDKQKEKQNLAPNEKKLLELLNNSNGMPLDAEEISDMSGIDVNHVYSYLKNMVAAGIVKDIIDDEDIKRYMVP